MMKPHKDSSTPASSSGRQLPPRKARRASVLAIALSFVLITAACSSSDDDTAINAEESTATTEPQPTAAAEANDDPPADEPTDEPADEPSDEPAAPLTASWTGVTEDTIRVGFTTTDLEELRNMGLVDLNRGDPAVVLDALVADVNARGGINGRMLDAHLEIVLPLGNTAADAACVLFTEDIEVFAVVSPFAGPAAEVNACINSLHATVIVGGQPTPEQLAISEAPWISHNMFSERRLEAVVQLMENDGLFGDTVGLVVTAEERNAANSTVIPALEALGKKVVAVELEVAAGDAIAANEAYGVFVERFRTEGVESVVLVENAGTFGATALVEQGFDTQVLIVDSTQLVAGLGNRGQVALEDLATVIGSGGASPEEEWELAATQDCIRVFEEANPDIEVLPTIDVPEGEADWLGNIRNFCTPLRLFELAANAAGPELTHESFLQGAEGLGEIELPFTVFASMAPGKLDAADAVRLTQFDPSLSATGGAGPYGPLEPVG